MTCYSLVVGTLFLYNCPYFVRCIHIKPIYFEDLQVDEKIDPSVKTKFQDIFTRTMNIMLALAITGLVNYALYKMKDSPLSLFELFGMLGGIMSLYRTIWDYIGKILLNILVLKKESHHEFIRSNSGININNNNSITNTNSTNNENNDINSNNVFQQTQPTNTVNIITHTSPSTSPSVTPLILH